MGKDDVRCNDSRDCFAKIDGYKGKICTLLTKTYPKDTCPFCKADREVTNGKRYPYPAHYPYK